MRTILVVANQTLAGQPLIDAVLERAAPTGAETSDDVRVIICVPRARPKHGALIYDEAVYDAAQVRIDLFRGFLRQHGIDAVGDVGDPDPYTATMDAVADFAPDEIIVSTLPAASSGWLKRDLIERIEGATGLPVTHVTTDVDTQRHSFGVTLVVANRTTNAPDLIAALKAKAADPGHRFIVVVPQEGGGGAATAAARGRLSQLRERARVAGLLTAGMVGDPDPYTATMNALELFRIGEVVISTLPETRSGWLRADLVERVRRATNVPVEHVIAGESAAAGQEA
jgi:nucleotide-binding universal stress UspA family protein